MSAYYNELEEFPCRVIETNIARGRLPKGRVHCEDICNVHATDLVGFSQLHLFAGIGAAAYACRLAGLPDTFSLGTFGFPCQDISSAGKGAGLGGSRSALFFEAVRIFATARPTWLLAENVPALRTRGADRACEELEGIGYTVLEPLVVGADDIGATHRRKRVWIVCLRDDVADNHSRRQQQQGRAYGEKRRWTGNGGEVVGVGQADAHCARQKQRCGSLAVQPQLSSFECGGGGMDDTLCEGQPERATNEVLAGWNTLDGASTWPARPNERQHDWEEPRTVESPMGGTVDGTAPGLVRSADREWGRWRRAALKGLGNAWCPQTAVPILRWMHAQEVSPCTP